MIGPAVVFLADVLMALAMVLALVFVAVGAVTVVGDLRRWHAEPGNEYRRALADLGRAVAGRENRGAWAVTQICRSGRGFRGSGPRPGR